MPRPSFRRTMTLESLEKREVLSAAPDGMRQYALELLNLARTNPSGAAQWISHNIDAQTQSTLDYYGVNLQHELNAISSSTPQPPLAWNGQLAASSQGQSQDQASNNFQGHTGSDGTDLNTRLSRVGYGDVISNGENAFAYAGSVTNAMEAFLIDWGVASQGHRKNILQPGVTAQDSYKDVGVGIVSTNNDYGSGKVGPYVITVDFGSQKNAKPELLGVAFDDNNHNGFYDPTEGHAHVLIQARNVDTGQVTSTESADAGGYQMALDPGTYQISGRVNGHLVLQVQKTITTDNVKVDFNLSNPWAEPADAPVAINVPVVKKLVATVATPTPTVTPTTSSTTQTATTTPTNSSNSDTTTPAVSAAVINPLSWITSWAAYRNGKRINYS